MLCRLIKAVDNLGMKLVIQDQTENIVFESLALTVTKVDGTNFGKTSLTIADPLNPQVITTEVQSNSLTFWMFLEVVLKIWCLYFWLYRSQKDFKDKSGQWKTPPWPQ